MKRVIITGATSMIGIAVINECIENGVEILAVVRKNSANLNRLPVSDLIKTVECDLNELNNFPIEKYSENNYDIFYHFAWDYTEKQYRNNAEYQNNNISFSLNAVNLAKKLGCSAFIGSGSQAEYGRVSDVISPKTPINPDIAYGIAKYAAGRLSSILCRELGLRFVWGRIFSVYGLYDNKNTMIMYAINNMLKGEKTEFTKCEQEWDYLYSKDAGLAFYLMGMYGKDGRIYCVGNGKTRKLSEYINIIHENINNKIPVGIGCREYSENQVMNLCADISTLTEDTGFIPRYSFEKGIIETIKWVKENK